MALFPQVTKLSPKIFFSIARCSNNSCNIFYYIHTEKCSPKNYLVNFCTQISSSQPEERTMVFTHEKNDTSNQNRERCFFTCEKNDTSNQKPEVWKFRAKIPAFYCSLQGRFAHIQREKFYSKSFSR